MAIETVPTISLIGTLAKCDKAVAHVSAKETGMTHELLVETAKELLRRHRTDGLSYGVEIECEKYIDPDSNDFIRNLIRRLLEMYLEIRGMAENPEMNDNGENADALLEEAEEFYYAADGLMLYMAFRDMWDKG